MSNIFTTETLDKAYLEYSNITTAKTAKELKLERENKIMRECLDKLELYARINHDKPKDYHDTIKECLAKLTEGEK